MRAWPLKFAAGVGGGVVVSVEAAWTILIAIVLLVLAFDALSRRVRSAVL